METPDTPNAIELSMAVMATTAQAVHVDVNMLAVRQKLDVKAVLTYLHTSPTLSIRHSHAERGSRAPDAGHTPAAHMCGAYVSSTAFRRYPL